MIRKILSVIVGYAIFVITSLLLFNISGQKPHSEASVVFMVFTFFYGAVFSFVSGIITNIIAKSNDLKANLVLLVIIAGFAIFSIFKSEGSHWTQLLAIFIFAPASYLGGMYYSEKKN